MENKRKSSVLTIFLFIVIIILAIMFMVQNKQLRKLQRTSKNNNTVVEQQNNDNTDTQETNQEEQGNSLTSMLPGDVKLNISEKLNQDKTFNNLKIEGIQLAYTQNKTQLLGDIKNNTDARIEEIPINIVYKDAKGKQIATVEGVINAMEPGEQVQLNVTCEEDYSEAYDFDIVSR